jgi:capsular polysaccharide biosynthesis protein
MIHKRVLGRIRWEFYVLRVWLARCLWLRSAWRNEHVVIRRLRCEKKVVTTPSAPAQSIAVRPSSQYEGTSTHGLLCRWIRIEHAEFVEPDFGYALDDHLCIIPHSLPGSEYVMSRSTLAAFSGLPSIPSYFLARFGKASIMRFAQAVSLRHGLEWTYYHLLFDVASRWACIEDAGIGLDVPIIIGGHPLTAKFFAYFTQMGALAERTWVIQPPGLYIQAGKILVPSIHADASVRARVDSVGRFLDRAGIRVPSAGTGRCIFIDRRGGVRRTVENMHEIHTLIEEFGIELVALEDADMETQISLFSNAKLVVGPHGAGMANIVFRRWAPLHLIDIQPRDYQADAFQQLCTVYGYSYEKVLGGNCSGRNQAFHVDPGELRRRLSRYFERA